MSTISNDTKITIGLAITLATLIVGGVLSYASLSSQISQLSSRVESQETETVTLAQMEAMALRMAIENPGLKVPDPRRPGHFVVVERAKTLKSSEVHLPALSAHK